MRTDGFTPESVQAAYCLAAQRKEVEFSDFTEKSPFFNYAVTSLGPGLSMDVECDTGLPVSTPAEKREQKFQQKISKAQKEANRIADRQRKIQEALAKRMTLKMKKEQRSKK